jgi:predicted GTPase
LLFHDQKTNIRHIFQRLNVLLSPVGFEDRIQASLERLDRETMNLLVVGEFSRGKSTFINALLGAPTLPSKVNPTTATINIIVPGKERKLTIEYHDNSRTEHALPDEQVNKFLDGIVTVSNANANQIKQIRISVPGPMEAWNCVIVDTPGVNDLDDLREEVTYNYLRNADACIILLDSQQPLSESERRFITEKVLLNDINRLLFVINRMDEVESEPEGPNAVRLRDYVKRLLAEKVPSIQEPIIHSVSAKEALRAKYKQESGAWRASFERFEGELHKFLSQAASKDRLQEHVDRAIGISYNGIQTISERIRLLSSSEEELEAQLSRLEAEEQRLHVRLKALSVTMDQESLELSRLIQVEVERRFSELRDTLIAQTERTMNESDIQLLKSELSKGIRQSLDHVLAIITEHKHTLSGKLQQQFADFFSPEDVMTLTVRSSAPADRHDANVTLSRFDVTSHNRQIENESSVFWKAAAAGGALTYVAAALMGPIGIVAGIIGSFFLGGKIDEAQRQRQLEQALADMKRSIRTQIDAIIQESKQNALQMAKQEIAPIEAYYKDHVNSRIESISSTLQGQRDGILHQSEGLQAQLQGMERSTAELRMLVEQLHTIRGTL